MAPIIVGIYGILNFKNHKIYIGSSTNLRARILGHRNLLSRGQHKNAYLQRAWDKAKDSFIVVILELCDKAQLESREQFWMDSFQSYNKKYGYNLQPKSMNKQLSAETKAKLSDLMKGRYVGKNNPNYGNGKAVQRDKNGRFDSTQYTFQHKNTKEIFFGTRYDFIHKFHLSNSNVCALLQGKLKSVKRWVLKII